LRRIAELLYTKQSVSGYDEVQRVVALFDEEPRLDAVAAVEADGSFGLVLRSRLTRDAQTNGPSELMHCVLL